MGRKEGELTALFPVLCAYSEPSAAHARVSEVFFVEMCCPGFVVIVYFLSARHLMWLFATCDELHTIFSSMFLSKARALQYSKESTIHARLHLQVRLIMFFLRIFSFPPFLLVTLGGELCIIKTTRMWANAQRDGRPAEYRSRRLFKAAKFG